jgi:NAD(P)H dehydrogenase (quinone)
MIVVLGAFGRTGRAAAALLESQGKRLVRRVTRSGARVASGREVVRACLADEAELGRALRGADALYAILPDDLSAQAFRAERRAMVEAMTRAIAREGIGRVVLVSSVAAALGERGRNGLGADLAYFERLVQGATASVSILRASYFQDNLVQVLPSAARDGMFPSFFAAREAAIPTIAAEDVGKFAAQLLLEPASSETEVVDLVGPSYSPTEMAVVTGQVLGRALSLVDVPRTRQEQTFGQWMSAEAARAMSETFECLGSGRALLQGERTFCGQTRLEQVLRAALTRVPEHASSGQP